MTARLRARDLSALLQVVTHLYDGLLDARTLGERVVSSIPTMLNGEAVTYSDLDLERATAVEFTDPPSFMQPAIIEVFSRYMHENPLVAHFAKTGDGRARKVSDLVTRAELHRTGLYNEYVRPFAGTEYQMAMAIHAGRSRVVGVSAARSRRDYSEREQQLLDLLRPHLVRVAAITGLVEQLADSVLSLSRVDAGRPHGLVALDRAARPRFLTDGARRLLEGYFGPERAVDRLPDALRRWILANVRGLRETDVPRAIDPFVVQRNQRTLTLWHRSTPDGHVLLMQEQEDQEKQTPQRPPPHLARWGLTLRESEVLFWVARGKTNFETALIIGVQPRTVDKHVERIFTKLGVQNRTAAAVMFTRPPSAAE